MRLDHTMFATMREATKILQSAGPMAATEAIQRALQGFGMPDAGMTADARTAPKARSAPMHDINPAPEWEIPAAPEIAGILKRFRHAAGASWSGTSVRQPVDDVEIGQQAPGKFITGSLTNQAGTRSYKVYVPSGYDGQALPLVVMLHGCKQNPDDFAAGTRMNQVAEENNCLIVYPGQVKNANMSNCWNWFQADQQQRDQGEPSIIADITREVMRNYQVDPRRVYVAGLSAGGAMAAIMGAAYPELYAAAGIHSGLPVGSAHDLPSAFAAMRGGMPPSHQAAQRGARPVLPVIVFHGDRDQTVNPRNGDQALAQCLGGATSAEPGMTVEKGTVPQGRAYTRTVQQDQDGKVVAEHWVVHGAGHAWSGGSKRGSYTDPAGPDATREMLRFFFTHQQPAAG